MVFNLGDILRIFFDIFRTRDFDRDRLYQTNFFFYWFVDDVEGVELCAVSDADG